MNTSKKMKAGFYFSAMSVITAICAMIAYLVLSFDGENTPGIVYGMMLLAIAFQIGVIVFNRRKVGRNNYNTGSFFAAVLFTASLILFILGRLEWIIQVQAHNTNYAPMQMSFYVAVIIFAVTIVISIAASFMPQTR